MQLSIELGSDPICGSIAVSDGEVARFSGWIDLTARLEQARRGEAESVVPPAEAAPA